MKDYDVIIIGGGINGLTVSAYLAKAGLSGTDVTYAKCFESGKNLLHAMDFDLTYENWARISEADAAMQLTALEFNAVNLEEMLEALDHLVGSDEVKTMSASAGAAASRPTEPAEATGSKAPESKPKPAAGGSKPAATGSKTRSNESKT